jgi:hypothetical protein
MRHLASIRQLGCLRNRLIPRHGFLRAAGGENLPQAMSVATVEKERFRSS